jgi:P27 family predicted phage terminase small subunit
MGKGAKQKSNVILMASGSKHARKTEPNLKKKIGPPPADLDDVELAAWKMVVGELDPVGTICEADRLALETLCRSFSRLRQASKEIKQFGITYEDDMGKRVKNPACTVATAENATIARYCAEFGITPASRGKVIAPPPAEINPFENL